MTRFHIVFDFDGTLFRTETVDVDAFNMTLREMGRNELSADQILAQIGKPLRQLARQYLKTSDQEAVDQFCRLSVGYELAVIPQNAELYPSCIEVLSALKANGHRLAICSNGTQEYIEAILKKFGIEGLFSVVYSKRQGVSKSRGAKKTVEALGAQRPCVFVGDREADIQAAKSNQMLSVGILHGFGREEELKEADYIVKDLNEFYSVMEELCHGQNGDN